MEQEALVQAKEKEIEETIKAKEQEFESVKESLWKEEDIPDDIDDLISKQDSENTEQLLTSEVAPEVQAPPPSAVRDDSSPEVLEVDRRDTSPISEQTGTGQIADQIHEAMDNNLIDRTPEEQVPTVDSTDTTDSASSPAEESADIVPQDAVQVESQVEANEPDQIEPNREAEVGASLKDNLAAEAPEDPQQEASQESELIDINATDSSVSVEKPEVSAASDLVNISAPDSSMDVEKEEVKTESELVDISATEPSMGVEKQDSPKSEGSSENGAFTVIDKADIDDFPLNADNKAESPSDQPQQSISDAVLAPMGHADLLESLPPDVVPEQSENDQFKPETFEEDTEKYVQEDVSPSESKDVIPDVSETPVITDDLIESEVSEDILRPDVVPDNQAEPTETQENVPESESRVDDIPVAATEVESLEKAPYTEEAFDDKYPGNYDNIPDDNIQQDVDLLQTAETTPHLSESPTEYEPQDDLIKTNEPTTEPFESQQEIREQIDDPITTVESEAEPRIEQDEDQDIPIESQLEEKIEQPVESLESEAEPKIEPDDIAVTSQLEQVSTIDSTDPVDTEPEFEVRATEPQIEPVVDSSEVVPEVDSTVGTNDFTADVAAAVTAFVDEAIEDGEEKKDEEKPVPEEEKPSIVTSMAEDIKETKVSTPTESYREMFDRFLQQDNAFTRLLKQGEEKTGVKRQYIVLIIVLLIALYLMFDIFGGSEFLVAFIGFLYPTAASIKAIESREKDEDTKWLTYWLVYSVFLQVEYFTDIFLYWIPFYWLLKCLFLVYCMVPGPMNGSLTIYRNAVRPLAMKIKDKIE